ncbi:amino acid permease-associated region [Sulfobacillus acidophilus TPY]|uniref:Amino acid permease-associated region n=1 Tax=Sulfobacillus acidophilus (strain ATCC 700253 / DSM 10332 / NAL) TaxID=679936 RepID=G8TWU7_SULAD|nr:amino acid permease-associated region [Sulfobacillus acidophilus TPY]AEW03795.1 amino acid permease-associated region [Sulfobacillus acidophilus DSM 10332]
MKNPSLSRVLPLRTAVSTSAGLASAAINFLAAVEVAQYAGGQSAWLAILVAGILIVLAGTNFAELNGLFPSAAAIRVWIRRGLNDQVSLVASMVYVTTVILVIAADAFVLGHMFQAAIPAIPGEIWILLILLVITGLNLRGIRVAGIIQDVNAFVLLTTLTVFSLIVIGRQGLPPVPQLFHTGPHWLEAVALGVFIYVGFEWVTPLSEEFQDFRAIPRGLFIALGLIAVAFGLFTLAFTVIFPHPRTTTLIPQLLLGMKALGPLGFWWMALVTLTTAMTTFNGGLLTASRFVYALARERVLPAWFNRLNQRWVPHHALWTLAASALGLAFLVYVSGQYVVLINAGAGVESLMYALTSYLVLRLRRIDPDRERVYRVPGVPIVPVIGGLLFLALGIGALLTPATPHGVVPWSLVYVVTVTLLVAGYVRYGVPKIKAARSRAMTARQEPWGK